MLKDRRRWRVSARYRRLRSFVNERQAFATAHELAQATHYPVEVSKLGDPFMDWMVDPKGSISGRPMTAKTAEWKEIAERNVRRAVPA